ncbi:FAD-dependent oxidoreductase [Fodinicola feengrottensis]|nr:FAD-dependent oxidoreductase [Fodinicola feengrottensis]
MPDVVVVGAGVMGSAAAWALAEAGREVVVLERFTAGHDRAGSHGETRLFRLVYDTVDYIRLAKEALSQWRQLESLTGRALLETTGGVEHGMAPQELRRLLEALAVEHVDAEVLDAAEAGRRWPGMRFADPVLFQPEAGRLKAADAIAAFHSAEADFRFEQQVERIDVVGDDGPVDIHTASGTVRAPRVIVAAGPWTPALVGKLPALRVTQEQPRHFRPIHDDIAWPNFVHWRKGGFDTYGLLAPGEGVKVGFHAGGPSSIRTVATSSRTQWPIGPCGRTSRTGFPGWTRRTRRRSAVFTTTPRPLTSSSTNLGRSPWPAVSPATASSSRRRSASCWPAWRSGQRAHRTGSPRPAPSGNPEATLTLLC